MSHFTDKKNTTVNLLNSSFFLLQDELGFNSSQSTLPSNGTRPFLTYCVCMSFPASSHEE